MRGTTYLVWRAALAVVLMVAFYGLALAAAAALLATPVLLARVSWGFAFKAGLFCIVGAFLIFKAILPRRDRFEPPGPRLDARAQPRLFAEIRRIAAATRQPEPEDVYLLADVNAFVTIPFQWFALLFFRVTHAISRHQEVKADQLAAAVVGREPLASGLQATDAAPFTFMAYWHGAVAPVLSAGFVPPIAAGFDTFRKAPWLADFLSSREPAVESPFDTHPPLPARLAALGMPPEGPGRTPSGPLAGSLLDDVPALESRLAAVLTNRTGGASLSEGLGLNPAPEPRALTPIAWDEVGVKAWLPDWEKSASRHRRLLEGLTPTQLPGLDWERLGRRLIAGEPDAEPLQAADPDTVRAWPELCARAGIAEVDLGSVAKKRAPEEGSDEPPSAAR